MENEPSFSQPPGSEKAPASSHSHTHKLGLIGKLRAYFLAGVLVTAPAAITIYLAWQFINFIDGTIATVRVAAGGGPRCHARHAGVGIGRRGGLVRGGRSGGILGDVIAFDFALMFAGNGRQEAETQAKM